MMSFAVPETIVAGSRKAFGQFLPDRATVRRQVDGGYDDFGFPVASSQEIVAGLSSVPCRLISARGGAASDRCIYDYRI